MIPPHFTSPPNPEMFKALAWAVVQQVPPGRVVTYGQVAALVGVPNGVTAENYRAFGARWVGGAMAACPPGVPWQRVINSQGKISLPGENGRQQRTLLEAEGVQFQPNGKIDLNRFGWGGPDSEQLKLF